MLHLTQNPMSQVQSDPAQLVALTTNLLINQEELKESFSNNMLAVSKPLIFSLKQSMLEQLKLDSVDTETKANIRLNILNLDVLSDYLQEALDQYYPSKIECFGLVYALEQFAERISESQQIEITVISNLTGSSPFHPINFQIQLYRLLELLINYLIETTGSTTLNLILNASNLAFNILIEIKLADENSPITLAKKGHNASYRLIQGRLALLNAAIKPESDWQSNLEIAIPYFSVNIPSISKIRNG